MPNPLDLKRMAEEAGKLGDQMFRSYHPDAVICDTACRAGDPRDRPHGLIQTTPQEQREGVVFGQG